MSIGKRLKSVRTDLKKTQKEVAALLGVSLSSYQYYERNERDVPAQVLKKIISYGVSPRWLLTGEGDKYEAENPQRAMSHVYNFGTNGNIKNIHGHNVISSDDVSIGHTVGDQATRYEPLSRKSGGQVDIDHISAIVGAIQSMDAFLKEKEMKIADDKKTAIILLLDQGIVKE